ncbi:MAG: adenine methyltransferase [Candidatus Aminicenantes bacterium]|nr:adenine methyltransferase [Candidatus Aminicenantes bacterium]NIQ69348.1 adenine methyltransferase [Candidatus Aminicenantes bacterium]NIT25348.1 adenine methyltransferase [Candidatus Aminicenantes bacterium]
MKVYHSSNKDDWETPPALFDQLNKEFKFTLDVAARADNAKCKKFFSPADDALKKTWRGNCFLNPPFSLAAAFVKKAHEEALAGRATTVALLAARTDTKWFHQWVYRSGAEIRFLKGRVKFVGARSAAPFPSMIVIWRKRGRLQRSGRRLARLGVLALAWAWAWTLPYPAARFKPF